MGHEGKLEAREWVWVESGAPAESPSVSRRDISGGDLHILGGSLDVGDLRYIQMEALRRASCHARPQRGPG